MHVKSTDLIKFEDLEEDDDDLPSEFKSSANSKAACSERDIKELENSPGLRILDERDPAKRASRTSREKFGASAENV